MGGVERWVGHWLDRTWAPRRCTRQTSWDDPRAATSRGQRIIARMVSCSVPATGALAGRSWSLTGGAACDRGAAHGPAGRAPHRRPRRPWRPCRQAGRGGRPDAGPARPWTARRLPVPHRARRQPAVTASDTTGTGERRYRRPVLGDGHEVRRGQAQPLQQQQCRADVGLAGRARVRGGAGGSHGWLPSAGGGAPCARMAWSTTAKE